MGGLRPPRKNLCSSRRRAAQPHGRLMVFGQFIRYAGLAVGLMEIENVIRCPALAVGLKPSARQGEARLRGRERIIFSKTISPRLRAIPGYVSKDHQPSARQGKARPGGLYRNAILKTHEHFPLH